MNLFNYSFTCHRQLGFVFFQFLSYIFLSSLLAEDHSKFFREKQIYFADDPQGYEIVLGTESPLRIRIISREVLNKVCKTDPIPPIKNGEHFSFFEMKDDEGVVLYVVNQTPLLCNQIDRDESWVKRREIGDSLNFFLQKKRLNQEDLNALNLAILTCSHRIALGPNTSPENILEYFFRNSQTEFDRVISQYKKGEVHYDTEPYRLNGPLQSGYSHIAHFSYIYWREIELLQSILSKNLNRNVVVLDLGSGGGNFIISAAHCLSPDELKRVKFIAIDKGHEDLSIAKKMFKELSDAADIQWVIDDLEDPGFINRLISYRADFIVVNHVLEHLRGNTEDYLHQWILATKGILSVTVPLNEELGCCVSSHRQNFTEDSILLTAKKLEERINHTAQAIDLDNSKKVGMLVFQKRQGEDQNGGLSGRAFSLQPESISSPQHPIHEDFLTPFDIARYNRVIKAEKIGELRNRELFAQQQNAPRQVRQLLIKMPGTDLIVPSEFEQFKEALQLIINHNRSINPEYDNYYAYLNVFRGVTRHDSYRGLSLTTHGDQMQCLRPEYAYNPDYSYIASNTLPTTLYEQAFDFSEALAHFQAGEKVNLYEDMSQQADIKKAYYTDNYGIYLLSPYIVHSASYTPVDIERVFMKVAFSSKRFFDNREERRNCAFDYEDWYTKETVGYTDGWLQHAHYNERFLKEDMNLSLDGQ